MQLLLIWFNTRKYVSLLVPIVLSDRESGASARRRRPRDGPHDAAQSQNGQKTWKGKSNTFQNLE